MHYLITTAGPISREHLTDTLLTYLNYPSYLSPNRTKPAPANVPVWPTSPLLGKAGKPGRPVPPLHKGVGKPVPPSPWLGKAMPIASPVSSAFKSTAPPDFLHRPSQRQTLVGREAGTPLMSQSGNPVWVAADIELQLLGNLGHYVPAGSSPPPYTNRQIDVSVPDQDYMGQVKTVKSV